MHIWGFIMFMKGCVGTFRSRKKNVDKFWGVTFSISIKTKALEMHTLKNRNKIKSNDFDFLNILIYRI